MSTDPARRRARRERPAAAERWRRGLTETVITLLAAALLSVLLRTYVSRSSGSRRRRWSRRSPCTTGSWCRRRSSTGTTSARATSWCSPTRPWTSAAGTGRGPHQARHRAARPDDLLRWQHHLHQRPPAGRAVPAGLRPARPADREQPASLPRPARRVLRPGRQPRGLLRQPLLGAHPGLQHRRQGDRGWGQVLRSHGPPGKSG